ASTNDGGTIANNYVARIEDASRLQTAIAAARAQCDFVIATMHAGTEYTRTPNEAQKKFAHAAIDDGADLVIGAHPHWVQTVEQYQGKYIFYSLGNFIFDQNWSQDTREGLVLKIQITKPKAQNPAAPGAAMSEDLQGQRTPAKLQSIELLPIIIDNSFPRSATPEETKQILDKINETQTTLYP
ncbi:MAG: CapA family protein, partial [Patescibacteria group bacterium]|nr:CapA family protein [Patescibacteria group bacterium]